MTLDEVLNNASTNQAIPQLLQTMEMVTACLNQMQVQLNEQQNNLLHQQINTNNGNTGNANNGNTRRNAAGNQRSGALPRQYCWTHGWCAHHGRQCRNKADGHKDAATITNCMNGSTKNVPQQHL